MNQAIAAVLMMVLCVGSVGGYLYILRGMPREGGSRLTNLEREKAVLERVITVIGVTFLILAALFAATLLEHLGLYRIGLIATGWWTLDTLPVLIAALALQVFAGVGLLVRSRWGFFASLADITFLGVTLYFSFGALSLLPIAAFFPIFIYLYKAARYRIFR